MTAPAATTVPRALPEGVRRDPAGSRKWLPRLHISVAVIDCQTDGFAAAFPDPPVPHKVAPIPLARRQTIRYSEPWLGGDPCRIDPVVLSAFLPRPC